MPFDFEKNDLCVVQREGGIVCKQPLREKEDGDDVVSWLDMTHERRYLVKRVLSDSDELFEFESKSGLRFSIRPMTMARYRSDVKPRLIGSPDIGSVRDLRRHFLSDTMVA